jgi:hypothetical protein
VSDFDRTHNGLTDQAIAAGVTKQTSWVPTDRVDMENAAHDAWSRLYRAANAVGVAHLRTLAGPQPAKDVELALDELSTSALVYADALRLVRNGR